MEVLGWIVGLLTIVFNALFIAGFLSFIGARFFKESTPLFAKYLRMISILTGACLLILITLLALVTGG